VDYEIIPVDLQDKPQQFLDLYARANPLPGARAKVPLLQVGDDGEDDGAVLLCESLVVVEYIAERFAAAVSVGGSDGGGILPPSAEDRAKMRLFTELCGTTFSYFPLLRAKDEKLETALDSFKEGLVSADSFLSKLGGAEDGPFLFGTRFSLAECNSAPFVQRACTVLPALTGGARSVNPIEICDELQLVRLKEWIEAVLARPSVVATGVRKEDMIESTTRMLERFAAMDK